MTRREILIDKLVAVGLDRSEARVAVRMCMGDFCAALTDHYIHNTVCSDFRIAVDVLEDGFAA